MLLPDNKKKFTCNDLLFYLLSSVPELVLLLSRSLILKPNPWAATPNAVVSDPGRGYSTVQETRDCQSEQFTPMKNKKKK